jgi:hypothetical protein
MTTEIQQLKEDISILQEKLQKLEEIEKQPRMNLQQEGEYAVVSYHDKVYYRLEGFTFLWYIKKGVPTPTLVMVEDAETERLLEGLYYNHIQVKKEKEQRTKSPVEECYKDWWGQYPELENDTEYDDTRWQGFRAGYHFAYEEKVAQEPEENEWKSVALRFGEKLSGYLSDGYYELSPAAWFRWAVFTYGKGQHIKDAVRESVKWCEEHPDKDPLDWLKPQTPEQVADGLKEAFREAVKQGIIPEIKQPTDELIDKLTKKPPEFLKFELGKSLTDLIYQWWGDVFTTHSDWDMETSIEDLVDQIQMWLPKEQSAAGSQSLGVEDMVEGFNDCLKKIKGKLR